MSNVQNLSRLAKKKWDYNALYRLKFHWFRCHCYVENTCEPFIVTNIFSWFNLYEFTETLICFRKRMKNAEYLLPQREKWWNSEQRKKNHYTSKTSALNQLMFSWIQLSMKPLKSKTNWTLKHQNRKMQLKGCKAFRKHKTIVIIYFHQT